MLREVKYRKIERVLQRLGFQIKRPSGSHVTFVHPETRAIVLLSSRHGNVSRHQVAYIRRILIENELISEREFDDLLK